MTDDTPPSWSILIPTIGQREALFLRLLDVLLPQLDEFAGSVRVIGWRNDGQPSLGEIRDGLVDAAGRAGSEYVSFVDDDDLVPEYYVAEVMAALATRPDHIGFLLEYSKNGVVAELVEHSLRWRKWGRSAAGVLYRDLTHVDPIRTTIAQRGRFAAARAKRAEDRVWVRQVRPHLATEVYLDKIMYRYLWSPETSAWQAPERIVRGGPRPAIDHPHFSWHERSD